MHKRKMLVVGALVVLMASVVGSLFLFTSCDNDPYANSALLVSRRNVSITMRMDEVDLVSTGGVTDAFFEDVVVTARNMPRAVSGQIAANSECGGSVVRAEVVAHVGEQSRIRITAVSSGTTRIDIRSAGGGLYTFINVEVLIPARGVSASRDFGIMRPTPLMQVNNQPSILELTQADFDFFSTTCASFGMNFVPNLNDLEFWLENPVQGVTIPQGTSRLVVDHTAVAGSVNVMARLRTNPDMTPLEFTVWVLEPFGDVIFNQHNIVGPINPNEALAQLVLNARNQGTHEDWRKGYRTHIDYSVGVANPRGGFFTLDSQFGFSINSSAAGGVADVQYVNHIGAPNFQLFAQGVGESFIDITVFPIAPDGTRFIGSQFAHMQRTRRINVEVRNVFQPPVVAGDNVISANEDNHLTVFFARPEVRNRTHFNLRLPSDNAIHINNPTNSPSNAHVILELERKNNLPIALYNGMPVTQQQIDDDYDYELLGINCILDAFSITNAGMGIQNMQGGRAFYYQWSIILTDARLLTFDDLQIIVRSVAQQSWANDIDRFDLSRIDLTLLRDVTNIRAYRTSTDTTPISDLHPVISSGGIFEFWIDATPFVGDTGFSPVLTRAELESFFYSFVNVSHMDLFYITPPSLPLHFSNGRARFTVELSTRALSALPQHATYNVFSATAYALRINYPNGDFTTLQIRPLDLVTEIASMSARTIDRGRLFGTRNRANGTMSEVIVSVGARYEFNVRPYPITTGIWVEIDQPPAHIAMDIVVQPDRRSFYSRIEGTFVITYQFRADNNLALDAPLRGSHSIRVTVVNPLLSVSLNRSFQTVLSRNTLHTMNSFYDLNPVSQPARSLTTFNINLNYLRLPDSIMPNTSVSYSDDSSAWRILDFVPTGVNLVSVTVQGLESTAGMGVAGINQGFVPVPFHISQYFYTYCPDGGIGVDPRRITLFETTEASPLEFMVRVEDATPVESIELRGIESAGQGRGSVLNITLEGGDVRTRTVPLNAQVIPSEDEASDSRLGFKFEVFNRRNGARLPNNPQHDPNNIRCLHRRLVVCPVTATPLIRVDANGVITAYSQTLRGRGDIIIILVVYSYDSIRFDDEMVWSNTQHQYIRRGVQPPQTYRRVTVNVFDPIENTFMVNNRDEFLFHFYTRGNGTPFNDVVDVRAYYAQGNRLFRGRDMRVDTTGRRDGYFRLTSDINVDGLILTPIVGFEGYFVGTSEFSVGGSFHASQYEISNFTLSQQSYFRDGNVVHYGMFADLRGTVQEINFARAVVNLASARANDIVNVGIVASTVCRGEGFRGILWLEWGGVIQDVQVEIRTGNFRVSHNITLNFGSIAGVNNGYIVEENRLFAGSISNNVISQMIIDVSDMGGNAFGINAGGLVGVNYGIMINDTEYGGGRMILERNIIINTNMVLAIVGNTSQDNHAGNGRDRNMGGLAGRNEGAIHNLSAEGFLFNTLRGNTGGLVGVNNSGIAANGVDLDFITSTRIFNVFDITPSWCAINNRPTRTKTARSTTAIQKGIMNNYSNSGVWARGAIGGLVGRNDGMLTQSYKDFFINDIIRDAFGIPAIRSQIPGELFYSSMVVLPGAGNESVELENVTLNRYPTVVGGVAGRNSEIIRDTFASSAFLEYPGDVANIMAAPVANVTHVFNLPYRGDVFIMGSENVIVGGGLGYQQDGNVTYTYSELILGVSDVHFDPMRFHPDAQDFTVKRPLNLSNFDEQITIGGFVGYIGERGAVRSALTFHRSHWNMLIKVDGEQVDLGAQSPEDQGTGYIDGIAVDMRALASIGFRRVPYSTNNQLFPTMYRLAANRVNSAENTFSKIGSYPDYLQRHFGIQGISTPTRINFQFRPSYVHVFGNRLNDRGGINYVVPARENRENSLNYIFSNVWGGNVEGFNRCPQCQRDSDDPDYDPYMCRCDFLGYRNNFMPSAALFFSQGGFRSGNFAVANRYYLDEIFMPNFVLTNGRNEVTHVLPNDASGRVTFDITAESSPGIARLGTSIVQGRPRHFIQLLGMGQDGRASFELEARSTRAVDSNDNVDVNDPLRVAYGRVRFDIIPGITTHTVSTDAGWGQIAHQSLHQGDTRNRVNSFAVRKNQQFRVHSSMNTTVADWRTLETRAHTIDGLTGGAIPQPIPGIVSQYTPGLSRIDYSFTPYVSRSPYVTFRSERWNPSHHWRPDSHWCIHEQRWIVNEDPAYGIVFVPGTGASILGDIIRRIAPRPIRQQYTYKATDLGVNLAVHFHRGATELTLHQNDVAIDPATAAMFTGTVESDLTTINTDSGTRVASFIDVISFQFNQHMRDQYGNEMPARPLFRRDDRHITHVYSGDADPWRDDTFVRTRLAGEGFDLIFTLRAWLEYGDFNDAYHRYNNGFANRRWRYEIVLNIQVSGDVIDSEETPALQRGFTGTLTVSERNHFSDDIEALRNQGVLVDFDALQASAEVEVFAQELQSLRFQHFSSTVTRNGEVHANLNTQFPIPNIYADTLDGGGYGGLLRVNVGPSFAAIRQIWLNSNDVAHPDPSVNASYRVEFFPLLRDTAPESTAFIPQSGRNSWLFGSGSTISGSGPDAIRGWDGSFYFETIIVPVPGSDIVPVPLGLQFNIEVRIETVDVQATRDRPDGYIVWQTISNCAHCGYGCVNGELCYSRNNVVTNRNVVGQLRLTVDERRGLFVNNLRDGDIHAIGTDHTFTTTLVGDDTRILGLPTVRVYARQPETAPGTVATPPVLLGQFNNWIVPLDDWQTGAATRWRLEVPAMSDFERFIGATMRVVFPFEVRMFDTHVPRFRELDLTLALFRIDNFHVNGVFGNNIRMTSRNSQPLRLSIIAHRYRLTGTSPNEDLYHAINNAIRLAETEINSDENERLRWYGSARSTENFRLNRVGTLTEGFFNDGAFGEPRPDGTRPRLLNFVMGREGRTGQRFITTATATGPGATQSTLHVELWYTLRNDGTLSINTERVGHPFFQHFNVTVYERSSERNPILIWADSSRNPSNMTAHSMLANMQPGHYYILMQDITITAQNWTPVPFVANMLDGNGRRIFMNGLNVDYSPTNIGLFTEIARDSVVKNLNLVLPSGGASLRVDLMQYDEGAMTFNIGVLAGTNRGIITNVAVLPNEQFVNQGVLDGLGTAIPIADFDIVRMSRENRLGQNLYRSLARLTVYINNQQATLHIGGLVGINEATGVISNSRVLADVYVGNRWHNPVQGETIQTVPVNVRGATVAGFVARNRGIIVASYFRHASVINNAVNAGAANTWVYTAGFVGINENNGIIRASYVDGADRGHLFTLHGNNVAGFVFVNGFGSGDAIVEDCYVNIILSHGAYRVGFVFDHQGGVMRNNFVNNPLRNFQADGTGGLRYAFLPVSLSVGVVGGAGLNSGIFENNRFFRHPGQPTLNWPAAAVNPSWVGVESTGANTNMLTSFGSFSICGHGESNADNIHTVWWWAPVEIMTPQGLQVVRQPRLVQANNIAVSIRLHGYEPLTRYQIVRDHSDFTYGSRINPITIWSGRQFDDEIFSGSFNTQAQFEDRRDRPIQFQYNIYANHIRLVNHISLLASGLERNDLYTFQTIFGPDIITHQEDVPVLDGNSFEIRDIAVDANFLLHERYGNLDSVGMFQKVQNAVIRNTNFSFRRFTPTAHFSIGAWEATYTGGIAGQAINSTIIDVNLFGGWTGAQGGFSSYILGGNVAGGLFGRAYNTRIENVHASLSVRSSIGTDAGIREGFDDIEGIRHNRGYLELDRSGPNGISIAGGLVGYVTGNSVIARSGNLPGGRFSVSGEIVGGLVGLLGRGSTANNIYYIVGGRNPFPDAESITPNLNAKFYVGILVGINLGTIDNQGMGSNISVGGIAAGAAAFTITPQASPGAWVVRDAMERHARGIIAGGVAGYNSGIIRNINVRPTITNQNLFATGGIVGRNVSHLDRLFSGHIENTAVHTQGGTGGITATSAGFFVGGLVGLSDEIPSVTRPAGLQPLPGEVERTTTGWGQDQTVVYSRVSTEVYRVVYHSIGVEFEIHVRRRFIGEMINRDWIPGGMQPHPDFPPPSQIYVPGHYAGGTFVPDSNNWSFESARPQDVRIINNAFGNMPMVLGGVTQQADATIIAGVNGMVTGYRTQVGTLHQPGGFMGTGAGAGNRVTNIFLVQDQWGLIFPELLEHGTGIVNNQTESLTRRFVNAFIGNILVDRGELRGRM